MIWITGICFIISSTVLRLSGALAGPYDVVTFPVKSGDFDRRARGGTSVVYACNVGNEMGPCVDTPQLCTTQGGKVLGYCFFSGRYEGVCCSGLNPATAVLTTKPPRPNDDTTTAAPIFPTAPTVPTQTPPSTPSVPTQTPPTAPTMTTQTPPTAPTMTTQTPPTAPTMTTQTPPTTPSMPTQTPPTAPTMTTQTPPTAPTMTTQTPPTTPSMPTQTPPPAPSMPTETPPPAPSMPTETPPPAPSMPTETPPPAPSMPTETPPPAPSMPTQTPPTAPTMTTQTPPTAPTMTTQTPPTAPTMTTQTPPTAPSMPTQTPPPAPSMPTETPPPAPSMPTETPPPAPSMPTETPPPAPTFPAPPSSSAAGIFETTTAPPVPTVPTLTTQSLPPAPTLPPVTTQSIPTLSTSGSVANSSYPFPTFGTQPPFNMTTQPPPQFNMTTQQPPQFNMTTHQPPQFNITTHQPPQFNMTTHQPPQFNMTTQQPPQFNFTEQMPNMTMTTESMNFSAPTFPTTTASTTTTTAATTSETTTTPPPSMLDIDNCGDIVSSDIQSFFQNPSYPSLDTDSNLFQYIVVPQDGYCALRIEMLEALFAGHGMEGCATDAVVIINSDDSPTVPVCGLLQGYQWTVRQSLDRPIKIVVRAQSSAFLWNMNVTQIACSRIKPYQDYQSANCGVKNPKPPPGGVVLPPESEQPRLVAPTKLLRSKRKHLREILTAPYAPTKLLENTVLNRESNIKIIRGNETAINEWPWQALLMLNGRPLCGASLLTDEWLITAGHCVQLNIRYPLVSVMTVDLGDHDLRTVKETKNVVARISKIVHHIQEEGFRNDIALIKLATKVPLGKTIRPVCLPVPSTPPNTYAGQTGMTTGWGRTEDSVISPVLREASIPIISNEQCRQQWASQGGGEMIENGMICVGGGDVGTCNGDSGGPLVIQEEDRWRLIGITSFGLLKGCAFPGVASVFTRTTSYLDWIALNLA